MEDRGKRGRNVSRGSLIAAIEGPPVPAASAVSVDAAVPELEDTCEEQEPPRSSWSRRLSRSGKTLGWSEVRTEVGMMPVMTELALDVKAKHMARTDTSHVITEVESKEAIGELPLWMQGNREMAKIENIRARFALRHHPLVRDALEPWWRTAQQSMQRAGGDGHRMSKDEYLRIFSRVFTIMIEDEFSEGDAMETAEEEWHTDSKGDDWLIRSDFLDSLFELADMWTEDIDAQGSLRHGSNQSKSQLARARRPPIVRPCPRCVQSTPTSSTSSFGS